MMLGLRVGHSKICYSGILIILNWSCFRSSEPKKKILTLFCLSEKQEINLSCEKCTPRDFPGCPVVKNPPSDAGDMGSIPARGTKIPCATWQLSVCATTREPACHNENPAQPKKKKIVHFLHLKVRQSYSGDRELQPGSLLLLFLFTTPNPNSV